MRDSVGDDNFLGESWLQEVFKRLSHARVCVFIDACFSGSLVEKGARRIDRLEVFSELLKGTGLFLFCSSRSSQSSFAQPTGSMFTSALASALSGGAFDSEGYITLRKVVKYVKRSLKDYPRMQPIQNQFDIFIDENNWKIGFVRTPDRSIVRKGGIVGENASVDVVVKFLLGHQYASPQIFALYVDEVRQKYSVDESSLFVDMLQLCETEDHYTICQWMVQMVNKHCKGLSEHYQNRLEMVLRERWKVVSFFVLQVSIWKVSLSCLNTFYCLAKSDHHCALQDRIAFWALKQDSDAGREILDAHANNVIEDASFFLKKINAVEWWSVCTCIPMLREFGKSPFRYGAEKYLWHELQDSTDLFYLLSDSQAESLSEVLGCALVSHSHERVCLAQGISRVTGNIVSALFPVLVSRNVPQSSAETLWDWYFFCPSVWSDLHYDLEDSGIVPSPVFLRFIQKWSTLKFPESSLVIEEEILWWANRFSVHELPAPTPSPPQCVIS